MPVSYSVAGEQLTKQPCVVRIVGPIGLSQACESKLGKVRGTQS